VRVGVVAERQSGHVERRERGAEPRPRFRARRGRRAVERRAEVRRLCGLTLSRYTPSPRDADCIQ
jgi:hypothetical protein